MRYLVIYLLTFLLATSASATEFDPTRFPVANEAEARFREAWLAAPANPAQALEAFRSLAGDERLPADAVKWAIARYSIGEEAKAALVEIVAIGPASPFYPEALAKLAEERESANDWGGASIIIDKLLAAADSDRDRAAALARKMNALKCGGDALKAKAVAVELYTKYADQPASEAAAQVLGEGGDPLAALSTSEVYLRGKTLLDSGSRAKAVEAFRFLRDGAKKGATWTALDLGLGKALHYLRRYEESLPPLEAAAKFSNDPETIQSAVFWRARSLFGLDRGNEGAPELVKLAKRYPGASKAPQWLYQALRVFEGRQMTKEASAAKALLMKSYPNSDEAVEVRFTEAWGVYKKGGYSDAAGKFEQVAAGAGRGWVRAQALFWAARARGLSGAKEKAQKALAKLLAEYPVGYYSRAAEAYLSDCQTARWIGDARGKGAKRLDPPAPDANDLFPAGEGARAASYLRLGMADAARKALERAGDVKLARLRYWAEDFKGALKASGADWTEWPPVDSAGSGDKRFFFPLAYPASVSAAAIESDVHPHLVLAIAHTESHFDAEAYSPWEARGLMQFIPSTAKKTADELGMAEFRDEMLYDPPVALRLGARHLRALLERFDGNIVNAIAAYNAGEQAVAKWRREFGDADEAEFIERIPYKETRRYVKKVLTAIDAYDRMGGEGGLWP